MATIAIDGVKAQAIANKVMEMLQVQDPVPTLEHVAGLLRLAAVIAFNAGLSEHMTCNHALECIQVAYHLPRTCDGCGKESNTCVATRSGPPGFICQECVQEHIELHTRP